MKIDKLWVVVKPGPDSTLDGIFFGADLIGLGIQYRDGLKPENILAVYTTPAEAKSVAKRILAASKEYYDALGLLKSKGGN